MQIQSSSFQPGQPIPRRHTGDGQDLSPPLTWTAPPPATQSLALICDDPDAPRGDWVHWVLWNLAPELRGLEEGRLPAQVGVGNNDFGQPGYRGPSPPRGKAHRYFFHLYALDVRLNLANGATKAQLLKAMQGHVLATTELIGTYQRP